MNRVASIPLQRTMSGAIQKAQQKLAVTQLQLASGKKALDYASLGTEAVRNLSARGLVSRHEAHAATATRVGTTLELNNAHLTAIDDAMASLRTDILTAIGTGKASGLQEAIELAFDGYRASLNASEGGIPLFGGSQTDGHPFVPEALDDLTGLDPDDAFKNDTVRASARVAENVDIEFGMLASEMGKDLFTAFRTLAEAGKVGETPSAAQLEALNKAVGEIDTGLSSLRSVSAQNGRRQSQVEKLGTRAEERTILLKDIISRNEDADLGQVASDLAQHKTVLQASYSVFAQLSGLTLVSYLR